MANVQIPKRFSDKLTIDQALDGIVKTTLSSFGDILEQNHLYFFKEYTNHGIKHIQNVLESSDNLITDDTFSKVLGDKDIGCYILSVILHDIGMHIDVHGVQCLIDGDFDSIRIKELDNHTWKYLWNDYLNEARKFSGKQLKAIFGDENTIVREPPIAHPNKITEEDKMLVGEFIRRHHARLAHEIAIKGFPAKPNFLEFASNFDSKGKNLVGLIARSHGTGLRQCLDYIESIYGRDNRRFPNGIHATYLMVLLRIADYIQIDSGRTSKTLLRTKTFSSPVSELEHNAHIAIDNIDYRWHDDPERIFVSASPKDSRMYLKLKKLIKDIQFEFDISWAVLGELYGKRSDQDKPQIKYRRISSNLDDLNFVRQQPYVADQFSFKSNDEIIKLLVAPLYGNDPTYGVRELLQNAVDACRERQVHDKKLSIDYSPIIEVKIGKDQNGIDFFRITDNGIGMDVDVLKNYFLSAGASYRKSMTWQKEFLDTSGKSIVRRSGRFGVGILASFLIGESIHVETKKVGEEYGYKFDANLNSDQINVIKDGSIPIGTAIVIRISPDVMDILRWDEGVNENRWSWYGWYSLSNPPIKYLLGDNEIKAYVNLNPDNFDHLPLGWHSVDSEGYDKILWTYSKQTANVKFTCNGIVIPNVGYNSLALSLIQHSPQINVFDSNAFLPLTLDRNTCSEVLSFSKDLLEDLYKDFIAYTLVFEEHNYVDGEKIHFKGSKLNHPGFRSEYTYNWESNYGFNWYQLKEKHISSEFLNSILVSKNGFILNYNFFIKKLNSIGALLIQANMPKSDIIELDIQDRFLLLTENKLNSIYEYSGAIESRTWNDQKRIFEPMNSRVFLKSEKYDFLFSPNKKRISGWLKNKCKLEFQNFGLTCLSLDNPKPSLITDTFLSKYNTNIHFIREYEIDCPYSGDPVLDDLLEKYIGHDVIIPYSIEERKKKYPLAFKDLELYMSKYINKSPKESTQESHEDLPLFKKPDV